MNVVGICRFSLLGRGDWKVYQGVSEAEIKLVAEKQAEILFTPERMENRLATFQHLTLASLQAQTDQDFTLIVLASELMPNRYKRRLREICRAIPQVALSFFPLIDVVTAQQNVFSSLGLELKDTLQFRLDDDDAVCTTFVEKKRNVAKSLIPDCSPLAISFRSVLFCANGGNFAGIYSWDSPFFSAGAALFHPSKSIFEFGHFKMAKRFTSIVMTNGMSLVSHNGNNDTSFDAERIQQQKLIKTDNRFIKRACREQFPFLTESARALVGIPI